MSRHDDEPARTLDYEFKSPIGHRITPQTGDAVDVAATGSIPVRQGHNQTDLRGDGLLGPTDVVAVAGSPKMGWSGGAAPQSSSMSAEPRSASTGMHFLLRTRSAGSDRRRRCIGSLRVPQRHSRLTQRRYACAWKVSGRRP